MKIKIWSDLHLEWIGHTLDHLWTPTDEDKDTVLVLAGDIGNGSLDFDVMEQLCKGFKEVIRIHGNHEYWDNDYYAVNQQWNKFGTDGPNNFHFLQNDWRVIDGVRFVGGTMWTDFNNADAMTMLAAMKEMTDYKKITAGGVPIRPVFILREHLKFLDFLLEQIEGNTQKMVVITHHSPGNAVRRRGRIDSLVDHCYYADLEQIIGNNNSINLWVHGHTHQNQDYMINDTRVICNPYGYKGYAENKGFDRNLIIEI